MNAQDAHEVVVRRRFGAPAERVFDAWLDASMIGRWMFGRRLRDEEIVRIALDARVGGDFSFVVRRGDETIDHVGKYLAIDRPRRLVFTWGIANLDSSRVVVEIVPLARGCELTLTHALHPDWTDYAERTRGGWTTMLHALDSELTALASVPDDYGVVVAADTLRFERVLPGPIERVWAWLTEPDKRGQWLASGPMELRPGGKLELRFRHADLSAEAAPTPEKYRTYENGHQMHGRITRCYPLHVLAFTWGDETPDVSEVTFELKPQGEKVRLTVTHRRLADRENMRDVAGGWHTHLSILHDRMNGIAPVNFWVTHVGLAAEYARRLAT